MKMRVPDWIGRRERDPVRLVGSVVLRTGRSIRVTVVDMSPGGCRVECEETLPILLRAPRLKAVVLAFARQTE